jgi:hypothetical protein
MHTARSPTIISPTCLVLRPAGQSNLYQSNPQGTTTLLEEVTKGGVERTYDELVKLRRHGFNAPLVIYILELNYIL